MAFHVVRSLICVAAVVCCVAACVPATGRDAPRAIDGVLDLSHWDLRRDGPVSLAGVWDFYPGRLLRDTEMTSPGSARVVPDFWHGSDAGGAYGQGAGTYRLRVLLGEQDLDLGIRIPTVSTAFDLDVNGITVARAGRPSVLARDAVPACVTGVSRIPPVSVSGNGAHVLDLVVRASNHEYRTGGMWRAFVLGPEDILLADKRFDDGMIFVFFGGASATALVFLLIFLYRRRDPDNLYFALFVAVIALRSLVTGDYLLAGLPFLPFHMLIRLFYLSAFAPVPLYILFASTLFPEEVPLRMRVLTCAPFAVLALTLAAPLPVLTRSVYVLYPLLIVATIPVIVLGLGRAALRRRSGSVQMLAVSILLAIAAVIETLNTSLTLKTANLLFPALAVVVFVQASILARRSAAAFDAVQRLSHELAQANDGLDRQVHERTRELENAYTRIKDLSIKDPLTGSFNRRYLDQELVREVERAQRYGLPLSLLFCDLDHFKVINDRYGHGAGDDVLRAFSRTLFQTIREKVDWCARYGGEEFLIVAPDTRPEDAMMLAERLRSRAAGTAAETMAGSVPYTLSIGISGIETGGSFHDAGGAEAIAARLIASADEALYMAKSKGRNRVELAPR